MAATAFGPAWVPTFPPLDYQTSTWPNVADTLTVDADEEEAQVIGFVEWSDGGNHTFGTSGSGVAWLPGASITFQATATLRVGIKSSLDNASGPPGRATAGAAAFAVYHDLVGGTDTITSTTWRTDNMSAGTPFTLNHNQLVAVCWHLDITANAQSVKVRQSTFVITGQMNSGLLITSGPTFTTAATRALVILIADDGTIGWITEGCAHTGASASENIGNGNIYGNQFIPTVPVTINGVALFVTPAGTTNFDVGIWLASDPSTPLSSVSVDPQNLSTTNQRIGAWPITPVNLSASTAYVIGCKQNSATSIAITRYDVAATTHWPANGLDANYKAVKSTGGAAFAAENSSLRRMVAWARLSKFESGGGGGGGSTRVYGS